MLIKYKTILNPKVKDDDWCSRKLENINIFIRRVAIVLYFTVDFTKLWPQMFRTSLWSSQVHCEVHIGIHKPICKKSVWLVPEVKEANQMRSLQIGLWISLWTFELRNELDPMQPHTQSRTQSMPVRRYGHTLGTRLGAYL